MQRLRFFSAAIISACLFFACSGNTTTSTDKDSTSTTSPETNVSTSSNTKASAGDASFSCKIDGKDFSGKGTDQMSNAAMVTNPGIISFILSPIVAGQEGIPAQFAFHVADKGTTTIHGTDNPNYSARYSPANTVDNDYQCKEMTVTITSSGTRATGTFSGTLTEPKTDRVVPVTDGKFDIPYSTYSKK